MPSGPFVAVGPLLGEVLGLPGVPVLLVWPLLAGVLGLPGVPVLLVWPLLAGVLGLPGVPVLLVWPLLAGVLTLPFWPTVELIVSAPHPAVIAAAITSMVGKVYETSRWRVAPQIILEITCHPRNWTTGIVFTCD